MTDLKYLVSACSWSVDRARVSGTPAETMVDNCRVNIISSRSLTFGFPMLPEKLKPPFFLEVSTSIKMGLAPWRAKAAMRASRLAASNVPLMDLPSLVWALYLKFITLRYYFSMVTRNTSSIVVSPRSALMKPSSCIVNMPSLMASV